MTIINVIYVNQTSGKIEASLLDDLIAKGEIAAFCNPLGWVDVRCERKSHVPEEQKNSKKRERKYETTVDKGNCQSTGFKSREKKER